MTTLLYLMACLMSPAPLINLAESRAILSLVIALCGALLVAVPRLFLPPPVPIGIVTQNIQRLIFFSF